MTSASIKGFEALRDILYSRMRGVKDHAHPPVPAELAAVLRKTVAEARAHRAVLDESP